MFKINESKELFKNIFDIKYEVFIKLEPTYLVEKFFTTIDTIFMLFSQAITGVFISFSSIVITLFILFKINKTVFFLFLILIPIYYYLPKKLNKQLGNKTKKMQTVVAKNNKDIKALMANPEVIKQEGSEGLIDLLEMKVQSRIVTVQPSSWTLQLIHRLKNSRCIMLYA